MKMKCVFKCQYAGRTYRADDVVEIPETDLELGHVRSSFVASEAAPPPAPVAASAAPSHVEADSEDDGGLTRDQYMERLRGLHVPFSARAKRDELKKLFEAATAPIPM